MNNSHPRLRDLGIFIGTYPTGPHNAITDVEGILVGHTTLIYDSPRIARTGVTMIWPRGGQVNEDSCFAGFHCFNGVGEMTGQHFLEEFGILSSPIALTNTNQVGLVHEALTRYAVDRFSDGFANKLSVVAETWDGWLNDADAFHIKEEHVFAALDSAAGGPVAEGNVGGGTGMICHDFKGGIGTSSRLVHSGEHVYTLGVLVQTNYGNRNFFRVNGFPVGEILDHQRVPPPWEQPPKGGSIIIIIATDAPLLPHQCKRLARRGTIGLARTGGLGHNGSGDLFLAFATGNHLNPRSETNLALTALPQQNMDPFFEATAEAVEESIVNALVAAETMTGYEGHTAYALPLDDLVNILKSDRPGIHHV